jgi:hypothetical protein
MFQLLVEELLHTVYAAGLLVAESSRSYVNPPHLGAVDPQAMKFAAVPRFNTKTPKEPKTLKSQVSKSPKPSLAEVTAKKVLSTNKIMIDKSDPQFSMQSQSSTSSDIPKTAKNPNRLLNTTRIMEKDPGRQVSSQGCSRSFIIKVLLCVADYVKGKILPSIFTFNKDIIKGWLDAAHKSCSGDNFMDVQMYYGGPTYDIRDPTTHWSEPHQLYTWWKNNVERKTKFKILQNDAAYQGTEIRKLQR